MRLSQCTLVDAHDWSSLLITCLDRDRDVRSTDGLEGSPLLCQDFYFWVPMVDLASSVWKTVKIQTLIYAEQRNLSAGERKEVSSLQGTLVLKLGA